MGSHDSFLVTIEQGKNQLEKIQDNLLDLIQLPPGLELLGLDLDFDVSGLPTTFGIAACFMSIEELIERKLKELIDTLLEMALTNIPLMSTILTIVNTISTILDTIIGIINEIQMELMGIIGLIQCIQNSDAQTKASCMAELLKRFGVLPNIQELLRLIADLDICDLIMGKIDLPGIPVPGPVASGSDIGPNQPFPQASAGAVFNHKQAKVQRLHADVKYRLNDAITDRTGVAETPANLSMITTTHHLAQTLYTKISESSTGAYDLAEIFREFDKIVEFEVDKNQGMWGADTTELFKTRIKNVRAILQSAGNTGAISDYAKLSGTAEVINSTSSVGVTVYGPAEWDATTYFDLKADQRSLEHTGYHDDTLKYGVVDQEKRLNDRGITTGTLDWDDQFTGAYGGRLQTCKSCASTRYPGGTQLVIRNADGTPYDPAGKNPDGIYVVQDTGNAKLTYKKVDIYVEAREDAQKYKQSNMGAAVVSVLTLGTRTGKQYNRAQALAAQGKI